MRTLQLLSSFPRTLELSCVCSTVDAGRAVRTQLCLDPAEFECYTVGVDAEITFCLKELKVQCHSQLRMCLVPLFDDSLNQ